MSIIFHITERDDWKQAQIVGFYRTPSLDTQGFIHCSTGAQVPRTANKFYAGRQGLILLCIDTEKVQPEVRFEPPINPQSHLPEVGVDELFPHIYGTLNIDAVINMVDFPPSEDGTFALPKEINPGI